MKKYLLGNRTGRKVEYITLNDENVPQGSVEYNEGEFVSWS